MDGLWRLSSNAPSQPRSIRGFSLAGIPEVRNGDNIADLTLARIRAGGLGPGGLEDGDIVVVTSRIISKAEGRLGADSCGAVGR